MIQAEGYKQRDTSRGIQVEGSETEAKIFCGKKRPNFAAPRNAEMPNFAVVSLLKSEISRSFRGKNPEFCGSIAVKLYSFTVLSR